MGIKIKIIAIISVWMIPLLLFSANRKSLISSIENKKPVRHPVLLEVKKQQELIKFAKESKPTLDPVSTLKPNRVYLYYLEKESRWFWTMTDSYGKLPDPIEGIRSSTVVPGSYVGAENPEQRYLLNIQQILWVPTFQPEQRFLWIYANPPEKERLKVVTYSVLETEKRKEKKENE